MKKLMTLCLVKEDNKILLGMKKRGFGQGRWNGFGGKVKENEAIEEAAKREMLEESGIVVGDMEKIGVLDFSWQGKENDVIEVNIFSIKKFSGQLIETEEMKPEWFDVNKIPFEKMWPDDRHWVPLFLAGKKFSGRFLFGENDQILEKELKEI